MSTGLLAALFATLLATVTEVIEDKASKATDIFFSFGVVGVLAFILVGTIVVIIWMVLKTASKLIDKLVDKYLPKIIDAGVDAFGAMKDSQLQISSNQEKMANNHEKLIILHERQQESTLAVQDLMKSHFDGLGGKYKTQHTSSKRVEKTLVRFCEVGEILASKLHPEISSIVCTHLRETRTILEGSQVDNGNLEEAGSR